MGKYSERCEAEGIVFIPLVVDRFGGWYKDSVEVITKLGRNMEKGEEDSNEAAERLGGLLGRNSTAQYKIQVNLSLLQDLF